MKNYKSFEKYSLHSLLEEASRLYPEGWDLVSVLRCEKGMYFTGVFRKARK